MAKAMTARFDEETHKKIEEMGGTGWYGWTKSKILRVCIAFTYDCFKKLPKHKEGDRFDLPGELNKKFKTLIPNSRWEY